MGINERNFRCLAAAAAAAAAAAGGAAAGGGCGLRVAVVVIVVVVVVMVVEVWGGVEMQQAVHCVLGTLCVRAVRIVFLSHCAPHVNPFVSVGLEHEVERGSRGWVL